MESCELFNIIWKKDFPFLSKCTRKVFLPFIPLVILLFGFGWAVLFSGKKPKHIFSKKHSLIKGSLEGCILLMAIVDSIFIETYDSSFGGFRIGFTLLTPIIGLLFTLFLKKKSKSSSCVYLFLSFFLSFLIFLNEFTLEIIEESDSTVKWFNLCRAILCLILAIAASVTDRILPDDKTCPREGSSFMDKILFTWLTPLVFKGYKEDLDENSIWNLPSDLRSENVTRQFEKAYFAQKSEPKSILIPLLKSFGPHFFVGSLLKGVSDILLLSLPQILKLLIDFVSNPERKGVHGYFFAILLFVTSIFQSLVISQYFQIMFITSIKIRTALISIIYKKALKTPTKTEKSTGEIVNLMSTDVTRLIDIIPYINMVWSSPVQITLSIYMMYLELGKGIIAGVIIILVSVPLSTIVGSFIKSMDQKQIKIKDDRIKLINELFSGIRILKSYAWEPYFLKQVEHFRKGEIAWLAKKAYLMAGMSFLWSAMPLVVALSSFVAFVFVDPNNQLTAQKAFVTLSYINLMKAPMLFLPMIMVLFINCRISVKRISEFLNSIELDDYVQRFEISSKNQAKISVQNGSFRWNSSTSPAISDFSAEFDRYNRFTGIIGKVGSGKTSLLSGILGEMNLVSGSVKICGTIAYAPQEPWLKNASFRENILFGKAYEEDWYKTVLDACCLTFDIDLLPGGDLTEIGEKGINLSGGQKQRVGLARTLYSKADIYIFDDSFSAVDSRVSHSIFTKVLSNESGLLKNHVRILVTHNLAFLRSVDKVYIIEKGRLTHSGSYNDLSTIGILEKVEESYHDDEDPDEKKVSPDGNKNKSKLLEKENIEVGSVDWKVYLYYAKNVGTTGIILIFLTQIINQAASIGTSVWLETWSSETLGDSSVIENRNFYLAVYGGLAIIFSVSVFALSCLISMFGLKAGKKIHNSSFGRILQAPIGFFDKTPSGRVLNRFSKDINATDSLLPGVLRSWLSMFFSVIGTCTLIIAYIPYYSIIGVATGLIFYFIERIYIRASRQLKRLDSAARSPIFSQFSETLSGLSSIRAFQLQGHFNQESSSKVDSSQKCYYPQIMTNRWLAVRTENVGNLGSFIVAIIVVTLPDVIGPGTAGLVLTYSIFLTGILNWLVRMSVDVETNIISIERLEEYTKLETEDDWRKKLEHSDWPSKGKIEFKNYKLKYRSDHELVLKGLNFIINPGEKIGIVGRTGAGKSSLIVALLRIVEPHEGGIYIDGVDTKKLGLHDLREGITIIPQEPTLFSGSIRSNLDPNEENSDSDIWKALEMAHMKSHIDKLEGGLIYQVSEGGSNLSTGQRQLICLARALLKKSKILLLDEATAAVDWETDRMIQETIRTAFSHCTILTIAHRLKTILDYDKILVLDSGLVKEFDSPNNLKNSPNSIFSIMLKQSGISF